MLYTTAIQLFLVFPNFKGCCYSSPRTQPHCFGSLLLMDLPPTSWTALTRTQLVTWLARLLQMQGLSARCTHGGEDAIYNSVLAPNSLSLET